MSSRPSFQNTMSVSWDFFDVFSFIYKILKKTFAIMVSEVERLPHLLVAACTELSDSNLKTIYENKKQYRLGNQTSQVRVLQMFCRNQAARRRQIITKKPKGLCSHSQGQMGNRRIRLLSFGNSVH